MDITNYERVGKGIEALKVGLVPFVSREFIAHCGSSNINQIVSELRRILGKPPNDSLRPFRDMDAAALLKVMWDLWNEVFRKSLGYSERNLVSELRAVRNNWAHQVTFSNDDAYRALDSMHRLLLAVSSPQASVVEGLKGEQFRVLANELVREEEDTLEGQEIGGSSGYTRQRREEATGRGRIAEAVRAAVIDDYVTPARNRGERELSIVSGDVHKRLGLSARHPSVCNALEDHTGKLKRLARAELIDIAGPNPSSTTRFTYRLFD